VSPFAVRPAVCENVSQMDIPRPPSWTAPSTWYEAVAEPHRNPFGKVANGFVDGFGCAVASKGNKFAREPAPSDNPVACKNLRRFTRTLP
jgi:hypothetical protein